MMERFTCPDHGRSVVQLSLGRLDDVEALRAEALVESCPHCADWWQRSFGAKGAVEVDEAVAQGLAAFRAPRRALRRWWLAAAAAAVVTFGIGTLWWQQQAPSTTTEAVTTSAQPADAVLARWTFEEGVIEVAEMVVAPVPPTREVTKPEPAVEPAPVLQGGFESGDLSGWSSHT